MTNMEDFYDAWSSLVKRIARSVSRDFPDVESADLEQDLFVVILEKGWTDPESDSVAIILRKSAKAKAADYRAQHLTLSPQYNYRTSEVRKILADVFSHLDWISNGDIVPHDEEGTAVAPNTQSGEPSYLMEELLSSYSDIKRAWERLSLEQRKIIFERYALDYDFDKAGKERLRRAVERLTDNLNSYYPRHTHEGPGSRKAITSAHAQSLFQGGYSD